MRFGLTRHFCVKSADGLAWAPGNEEKTMQPQKALWIQMGRFSRRFAKDERGQDLVEYSLLLAFVCLVGAASFIGMGQTTSSLWCIVNTRLAAANQSS
jgi:Flp pilus assembly pilin Flp